MVITNKIIGTTICNVCRSFAIKWYDFFRKYFRHQGKWSMKFIVCWEFYYLVGVGGAVLRNKTNELLIIKERVRNFEFWKVKDMCIIDAERLHLFFFSCPGVSNSICNDWKGDNCEHVYSLLGGTDLSENIGKTNYFSFPSI